MGRFPDERNNLLCGPKQMRFAFVEKHRNSVPTDRLCRIMDVTPRGYRAWRSHPASRRQRKDLVLLAHIMEQHRLSLNSYGRPRMTEELKELGLDVGHRRVCQLSFKTDPVFAFKTDPPLRGKADRRDALI